MEGKSNEEKESIAYIRIDLKRFFEGRDGGDENSDESIV